ncbi:MAG: copper chaperone PCu(A)C [Burkholderiaceae bacterium]|nr:copper chaperone PCu(A)C [Burkholderiaceae bacterium]
MKKLFLATTLSCFASIALAQVTVSAPWVRATVPAGKVTGAFMQLRSAGDARLVEARSSLAGMVEMHRMAMDGQTMRMHAVDGIDLAAGKTVNLASGGYHIMLMDLKRQLKEGEMVPLTLIVEHKNKQRETIELSVPVKPLTYVAQAAPH